MAITNKEMWLIGFRDGSENEGHNSNDPFYYSGHQIGTWYRQQPESMDPWNILGDILSEQLSLYTMYDE